MKRFFYASLALVALTSCQKESTVDTALTTGQVITYSPYAGASSTKGTAINSNTAFGTNGSFEVSAYSGTSKYFDFTGVSYSNGDWTNDEKMYWPTASTTLHFGAYYPKSATFTSPSFSYGSANSLSFGYTVGATVADHKDVMYAITDYSFDEDKIDVDNDAVNLHFKHALTQVGFTATKDDDITVTVTSLKICNVVDNGTFTATDVTNYDGSATITEDQDDAEVNTANFGTWETATAYAATNGTTNLQNYAATMAATGGITVLDADDSDAPVQLTSTSDVMMLIPQGFTAWEPTGTNSGTETYLAIGCTIAHESGGEGAASIVSGTVYVPFGDTEIAYASGNSAVWKPGYNITYNLHFGGGYTIPGDDDGDDDPEPGETPDPDDIVSTLRDITYTVTVDEWIPVDANEDIDM